MATWFIYEIYRDPTLLSRVRSEITSAVIDPTTSSIPAKPFDLNKLVNGPLLQSIYAETLRLRMSIMSVRSPESSSFKLGPWLFHRGDSIAIFSTAVGMNKDFWNETDSKGRDHPTEEFWADRFVLYPDDPTSGPLKQPVPRKEKVTDPTFTMDGTAGSWIPYGGGVRMCPGRTFAKQEMMASLAFLATYFDVELMVDKDFKLKPDMSYYMMGGMPPERKVPFRIRRRQA